jgi:acyl dehydratase
MDAAQEIGELRIDALSQMNFARLTGDYNPVHVDAAVGRRSSFGNVIAHGMNVALSATERYLAARLRETAAPSPDIARIQLQFLKPVFVDEPLSIVCVSADRKRTRFSVRHQQSDLATITLVWRETASEAGKHPSAALASQQRVEPRRRDAVRRRIQDGDGVAGKLPLQIGGDRLAHAYPRCVDWLGERTVAGLALLNQLTSLGKRVELSLAEGGNWLRSPRCDWPGSLPQGRGSDVARTCLGGACGLAALDRRPVHSHREKRHRERALCQARLRSLSDRDGSRGRRDGVAARRHDLSGARIADDG